MRIALVLLIAVMSARSADLMSWFPLRVGARWVYDCKSRSGTVEHFQIARWRETVTVKEHIQTAEGLVIVRDFAIEGRPNPVGGFWRDRLPYLWKANCLHPLYPEMWDARAKKFTAQFATMLAESSPDFCFPLAPGAQWRSGGDWAWRVDGRGPLSRGPQDVPVDGIRVVQEASGGPNYVWFVEGVGPVASWTWHNGTYTESFARLVESSVRH